MPSRWPTNDHRPFVRSLSIFCPFEYPHPRSLKFDKVKYTPRSLKLLSSLNEIGVGEEGLESWPISGILETRQRIRVSSPRWPRGPIRFLVKTFFFSSPSLPPRNFFPLFPVNYRPHRWYLHSSAIPWRKCNFPWVNLPFLPTFFFFSFALSLPFQSYLSNNWIKIYIHREIVFFFYTYTRDILLVNLHLTKNATNLVN